MVVFDDHAIFFCLLTNKLKTYIIKPMNKCENKGELKRVNFAGYQDLTANINPADVPNLVKPETLAEWQKNDSDPYYKVQVMDYPIKANGIWYNEAFFESFLSKLSNRPIPGSKTGHSLLWGEKPSTDLLLIGGKLERNGDGTGKVYFKNYIPPVGETGDNSTFILENKSGMIHYSLVTYPKMLKEESSDGEIVYTAIESIKGERNDAVEYGNGAMEQVTNHAIVDGDNEENKDGEESMNKDEILKKLNSMRANGDITLLEVAKVLNLEDQVVTAEHQEALKLANSFKEAGFNSVDDVKKLQDKITADADAVFNAKMSDAFGKESKENLVRSYAAGKLKNSKDIDADIEKIKSDPILIALNSDKLDPHSDVNIIEKTDKAENASSGARVDKL